MNLLLSSNKAYFCFESNLCQPSSKPTSHMHKHLILTCIKAYSSLVSKPTFPLSKPSSNLYQRLLYLHQRTFGHFRFIHNDPVHCINEYLAIDSGGNLNSLCTWLQCLLEKPSWCRNEQLCQGVKCKEL